eukprot:21012-Heterococcus_DN1.PRE.1
MHAEVLHAHTLSDTLCLSLDCFHSNAHADLSACTEVACCSLLLLQASAHHLRCGAHKARASALLILLLRALLILLLYSLFKVSARELSKNSKKLVYML